MDKGKISITIEIKGNTYEKTMVFPSDSLSFVKRIVDKDLDEFIEMVENNEKTD